MESSRQVLIAFHSGDSLDLAVACEIMRDIASVVKRLADLPERLLGDRSSAKPAVTVAILAILTSLAGPDVEQTALSTTALADLASIVRRVHGVSMETGASSDDSEAMSQVVLLESLSKLPPATGDYNTLHRCTIADLVRPTTTATSASQDIAAVCATVRHTIGSMAWPEPSTTRPDEQDGPHGHRKLSRRRHSSTSFGQCAGFGRGMSQT